MMMAQNSKEAQMRMTFKRKALSNIERNCAKHKLLAGCKFVSRENACNLSA